METACASQPLFAGSLSPMGVAGCDKYAPLDRQPSVFSESARVAVQPPGAEMKTVEPRDLDDRTQAPAS